LGKKYITGVHLLQIKHSTDIFYDFILVQVAEPILPIRTLRKLHIGPRKLLKAPPSPRVKHGVKARRSNFTTSMISFWSQKERLREKQTQCEWIARTAGLLSSPSLMSAQNMHLSLSVCLTSPISESVYYT